MERLFAMMLMAFDRRRNPAAGLFYDVASQTYGSMIQLLRACGTVAERSSYTIKDKYVPAAGKSRPNTEHTPRLSSGSGGRLVLE